VWRHNIVFSLSHRLLLLRVAAGLRLKYVGRREPPRHADTVKYVYVYFNFYKKGQFIFKLLPVDQPATTRVRLKILSARECSASVASNFASSSPPSNIIEAENPYRIANKFAKSEEKLQATS
jgi:hypothetical protein